MLYIADTKGSSDNFGIVRQPFASLPLPCEQPIVLVESKKNYDEERHILKEKRSKPVNESERTNGVFLLKKKSKKKPIDPNPNNVSFHKRIMCLANIYCTLLDYNMVPNVTAEVHFIFSLLTIQSDEEMIIPKSGLNDTRRDEGEDDKCSNLLSEVCTTESESNNEIKLNKNSTSEQNVDGNSIQPLTKETPSHSSCILCTIHNCVWFASVVIQGQIHLIQDADKTTLKLLIENERLKLFLPDLIPQLSCSYQKKVRREIISVHL